MGLETTMKTAVRIVAAAGLALPLAWSCASDGSGGPPASGAPAPASASATPSGGATTAAQSQPSGPRSVLGSIPSLVNVNLRNVLNDLAIKLNIDSANVPINIQLPIQLAANVCGVSINILSVSTGGQANCSATTAPQDLAQVVQQQLAAGGSVGGGAQGGSTATTATGSVAGAATGGATDTTATSSGGIGNTTTPTTTTAPAPTTAATAPR
jgi:hypothetical protein